MMDDTYYNEVESYDENSQGSYEYDEGTTGEGAQDSAAPSQMRNQPKLIISDYSLEPKIVKAGEDFYLDFTLYNTNNENTIYNLKVTIDQTLASSPAPSSNQALVSDGSVFTPVDRSNTFYVAALYPRNYTTKEIRMNVLPNANPGSYVINVNMEYEDYLGNQYKTTEAIGIPVTQEASVNFGKVKMDEAMVGSQSSVSVNIYNTGKDNLYNFMVRAKGKGFTIDEDERFIGNFNSGSQETFSFNITPDAEGAIEGEIEITYEDSAGKEHRDVKDFKGEVNPGFQDEMMGGVDPETGELIGEDPTMEEANGSIFTSPFFWIGLIIVAVLVGVLIRKKRKAKKEEELLIEDED